MKIFAEIVAGLIWLITVVMFLFSGQWIWGIITFIAPPVTLISSFFVSPVLGFIAIVATILYFIAANSKTEKY